MYIPEYTITNGILTNIAVIEFVRATAQAKIILPSWEKNQQKEAKVQFIKSNLNILGIKEDLTEIRKVVDKIAENPARLVQSILTSIDIVRIGSQNYEIDEKDVEDLYRALIEISEGSSLQMYREMTLENKTPPEEILSEVNGLLDWMNSLDGKETHPIIKTAIVKGRIMEIEPFRMYNELMSNLLAYQILKAHEYTINDFCRLEMAYAKDLPEYKYALETITKENDLTAWIDFYTDAMAREASNAKEQILLLAKDSKIARVTGTAKLSGRQERILAYLQDYGLIQNKDFPRIFPDISEDTVLRELKRLVEAGIVAKNGSTKLSRYELK